MDDETTIMTPTRGGKLTMLINAAVAAIKAGGDVRLVARDHEQARYLREQIKRRYPDSRLRVLVRGVVVDEIKEPADSQPQQ